MPRRQNDPLRPLTDDERHRLEQISRAQSEPASHVARAKLLLAVAAGQRYTAAAQAVGRRSNDAVANLVGRFTREGRAALAPRHGGGALRQYGTAARERILAEVHRAPDRARAGTARWSRSTLQSAGRQAADGRAHVSTFTLWCVLRDAGYTWQRDRTWCATGQAVRIRKRGQVTLTAPAAQAQNGDRAGVHDGRSAWPGGVGRS